MKAETYVPVHRTGAPRSYYMRVVEVVRERRMPYRLDRWLNKFLKSIGVKQKTVNVKGLKIRLRRLTTDEMFVHNVIVNEEYNPPGYEIGETDTIIDIGGNIGTFAVLAAQKAKRGRVLTFEPVSENYSLLLQNIAINQLDRIEPQKLAVLDERKRISIYVDPAHTGAHSIFRKTSSCAHSVQLVDTITLQDVFTNYDVQHCDFLKMDCEGAEYQIIYALPQQYFARIDRIVMEYHTTVHPETVDEEADRLVDYLQTNGYQIDAYQTFGGGGFIRARR